MTQLDHSPSSQVATGVSRRINCCKQWNDAAAGACLQVSCSTVHAWDMTCDSWDLALWVQRRPNSTSARLAHA